jgi:hypothetical protein
MLTLQRLRRYHPKPDERHARLGLMSQTYISHSIEPSIWQCGREDMTSDGK